MVAEKSILDPQKHKSLIADLEGISSVAGVQARFLDYSMSQFCGSKEVDWVRNFRENRKNGVPGLVLEGVSNPDSRCQAIAAAFLRNYIDAKVIPIGTLIDLIKSGKVPMPTVLLIPNFFVEVEGKGIPSWRMQEIYDFLLQRVVHNKPTVLYVQNSENLEKTYGTAVVDLLSNFHRVKQ
jgi:hypothetical protein